VTEAGKEEHWSYSLGQGWEKLPWWSSDNYWEKRGMMAKSEGSS
jgi:hypothetical protein